VEEDFAAAVASTGGWKEPRGGRAFGMFNY